MLLGPQFALRRMPTGPRQSVSMCLATRGCSRQVPKTVEIAPGVMYIRRRSGDFSRILSKVKGSNCDELETECDCGPIGRADVGD